jgi:hypothetical protein
VFFILKYIKIIYFYLKKLFLRSAYQNDPKNIKKKLIFRKKNSNQNNREKILKIKTYKGNEIERELKFDKLFQIRQIVIKKTETTYKEITN